MKFIDYCKQHKPQILNEWDASKNGSFDSSISYSSHKKYWFKCSKCGTSFETSPHSISNSKYNCCPKCWITNRAEARHVASYKKRSLESVGGILLDEFDVSKNKISAAEVSANTNKKYWWKCSICGHEWMASVSNRIKGTGCPHCNKTTHTSFPEQAIFYYVKKEYPDAINSDKHLGVELDIYIPSLSIAIEYDGEAWHQNIKKDEKKNNICAKNKILLIRIREQSCWFWPESTYLKCLSSVSGDNNELSETIKRLFFAIRNDLYVPDIDVVRDEKEIRAEYINAKKNNSLKMKYPDIAGEWDYEKNKPVVPEKIDYGSGTRYWWICSKCGYSYKASPNSRTCKGSGCPSCAHIVANPGVTDLKTKRPDLMEEWDYAKNNKLGLNPSCLLPNSEKKAWWKCRVCGHEWLAMIGNRTRGRSCSLCAKENHKRKVKNLDTGMVFNSVNEAGKYYGKEKNHHINECCQGKRKTVFGYRWKYID